MQPRINHPLTSIGRPATRGTSLILRLLPGSSLLARAACATTSPDGGEPVTVAPLPNLTHAPALVAIADQRKTLAPPPDHLEALGAGPRTDASNPLLFAPLERHVAQRWGFGATGA